MKAGRKNITVFLKTDAYETLQQISKKYKFKHPGHYVRYLISRDIIEHVNEAMSKQPLFDNFTDIDII